MGGEKAGLENKNRNEGIKEELAPAGRGSQRADRGGITLLFRDSGKGWVQGRRQGGPRAL